MIGLISAVVFGLVAGIVAKLLMPGRDPGGCIITSIIGIVGALIGQLIGTYLLNLGTLERWSIGNFLLAVVGAIILLIIYRLIAGRRTRGVDRIDRVD